MDITSGEIFGLKCVWMENADLRLALPVECGLRVLYLSFQGGENLFAELGDRWIGSSERPYKLLGGHRLWHSPEWAERTYFPEEGPFLVEESGAEVSVTPRPDLTGIVKSLRVTLFPAEPRAVVTHTLTNRSLWSVSLAPWAITQFRLGGWVVCPHQMGLVDDNIAIPNRAWVFWPFTDVCDPRFVFGNEMTLVNAQPGRPTKIGFSNSPGWLAYWREGVLFSKHFDPCPKSPHTDTGVSAEVYVCEDFVELETLGALAALPPGGSVTHTETWDLRVEKGFPYASVL